MTFTERNFPPPEPAGEAIPDGVRVSLLAWFADQGITSAQKLWPQFCQREGYGSVKDVSDDIAWLFGPVAGTHFEDVMQAHFKRQRGRRVWSPGYDYEADPALGALPTPQFLDVLELAVASADYQRYQAVQEINRLFSKRGVNYRFDESSGLAEWHGDQSLHAAVVRPALDCLTDPRLAGAKSEFDAALHHMRNGSTKDLEDVIEEAAKSVESVMKVLAGQRGVKLTGKETAKPLFDALATSGVVTTEADQAVLAPSRLRNAYGGHGAGAQPRQIPAEVPELTLRSAATAVTYLGAMLGSVGNPV